MPILFRRVISARPFAGRAALLLSICLFPAISAAGILELEILARPAVAPPVAEAAPAVPPGAVAVFGFLEHPGFHVESLAEAALFDPDERAVPLWVEEESIFTEFGEIVGFRCAFPAGTADLEGGRPFTLRWGEGVRGENRLVRRFSFTPEDAGRLRGFRPATPATADDDVHAPAASIRVIADSTADYHFAWYLLPIAVLFAILTARKKSERHH